jgi:hypothetical protein
MAGKRLTPPSRTKSAILRQLPKEPSNYQRKTTNLME